MLKLIVTVRHTPLFKHIDFHQLALIWGLIRVTGWVQATPWTDHHITVGILVDLVEVHLSIWVRRGGLRLGAKLRGLPSGIKILHFFCSYLRGLEVLAEGGVIRRLPPHLIPVLNFLISISEWVDFQFLLVYGGHLFSFIGIVIDRIIVK